MEESTSRLEGKIAIIAGEMDEIGQGIAQHFIEEGAKIAFVHGKAQSSAVQPVKVKLQSAVFIDSDIKSLDEAHKVVTEVRKQLGGCDILVNNTIGRSVMSPFELKPEGALDGALKSMRSAFLMMQAVFPLMRDQQWGRIVNIGSRYGERMNIYNGEHNMAAWAMRGMTRTAAAEWAGYGIRVNVLEIAADTEDFRAFRDENPEIVDYLVEQVALGRRGDPADDIGAAATFMACDEVNWINGEVFYADGGQHLAATAFVPALHMGFAYPKSSVKVRADQYVAPEKK